MLRKKYACLELIFLFFISCASPIFATQTIYTFYPTEDTFITGYEQLNSNNGLQTNLRIQHPPRFSNVVLKFSQQSLKSTIGTNHVISANLKLYIETNFNNWGSGAYVDVHRLNLDWGETTATWNCPVDTNTGNTNADCDLEDQWLGGEYDEGITTSVLHQNNQTGWKTFDVTSDVQIFLGEYDHFGWLIQKRDSSAGGL